MYTSIPIYIFIYNMYVFYVINQKEVKKGERKMLELLEQVGQISWYI